MYCRPPLKKSYVSGPGHTPLLGSTVGIIGWKKQLKCGQGIKLEPCICCHTSKSNRLDKNIGWWASGGVSTTMGWSRGSCLMPSGDQEDVLSGGENSPRRYGPFWKNVYFVWMNILDLYNSERPVDALAEKHQWLTDWLTTWNQEMLAHLKIDLICFNEFKMNILRSPSRPKDRSIGKGPWDCGMSFCQLFSSCLLTTREGWLYIANTLSTWHAQKFSSSDLLFD